jgi:hypothetical protein
MEGGNQTTLDGANTTALSTQGLQDPNTACTASDKPDHVTTTKKPATDAHGAANSRFSRFSGLWTRLGCAVLNAQLVTAPVKAVQGAGPGIIKLMKLAYAPVRAAQNVGRNAAMLMHQIFDGFNGKAIDMHECTVTIENKPRDFDLTTALIKHGQLVDAAHKYVFKRSLGAGLLATIIGYAASHTPLANTQMGQFAPFAIGVAITALARKFFQAKARYGVLLHSTAIRERAISAGKTNGDVEQAFNNARTKYNACPAGIDGMREIIDAIKCFNGYCSDLASRNDI